MVRLLLTGVVLTLSAFMMSGCVGDGGFSATFSTNWSSSDGHFFLVTNDPLPEDLRVVVLEKETGVRQEFEQEQLIQRLPGTYDIRSSIGLSEGNHYQLEAFQGARSIAAREVQVQESALDQPSFDVRAAYSFGMVMREHEGGMASDLGVQGTLTLDGSPSTVVLKMNGAGSMNTTEDDFRMHLTITRFDFEEQDEETTKATMMGQGTWTLTGDPSGQGQATLQTSFLGRETKTDEHGRPHLSEKSETQMTMEGTITSDGFQIDMESRSTEIEWARVDTGEAIWRQSSETTTWIYPDGSSDEESEESDGPVSDAEAEPSLLEVTSWSGPVPYPIASGDNFRLEGLAGITIQYRVSEGGTVSIGGHSFQVLQVEGTVADGATGTEKWGVVSTGPLATLPVTWEEEYQRGEENFSFEARLTSIT